jgi:flagellar protein FliS
MSIAAKAYTSTRNQTNIDGASSADLIVIVYERIFDHLIMGKEELLNGGWGVEYFSKAIDLINMGLLASLDLNKGGQIAENLKNIYEWSIASINSARLQDNPEKIQEVVDVLKLLHEGWLTISPKRGYVVLTENKSGSFNDDKTRSVVHYGNRL